MVKTLRNGRWIAFLLVLILLPVVASPSMGQSPPGVPGDGRMTFRVTADGSSVGKEQYRFRRDGDDLIVERTVKIDFSFFYVPVASYRHRSEGTWRDGSLFSLTSSTDFRGDTYAVRVERTNGRLVLREGREKGQSYPADASSVVPTTWWNPRLKKADRLLDTQYGRILDVSVVPAGSTQVPEVAGIEEAQRFDVKGELELSVWYTADGQLVKLRYSRGGYTFVHRRSDY